MIKINNIDGKVKLKVITKPTINATTSPQYRSHGGILFSISRMSLIPISGTSCDCSPKMPYSTLKCFTMELSFITINKCCPSIPSNTPLFFNLEAVIPIFWLMLPKSGKSTVMIKST